MRQSITILGVLLLGLTAGPARAELVEEIVAWVNGEIITMSELDEQEQVSVADAYRTYTGEQLDQAVEQIRNSVLLSLIDTKILVDRAARFYDLERMGDIYFKSFMEQQGFTDRETFLERITAEGFTESTLRKRLIDMFAPEQVIQFEVKDRMSVADSALVAYYDDNPELFVEPARATIRELVLLADTPEKRAARRAELDAALARIAAEGFEAVALELSESGTRDVGGLIEDKQPGDLSALLDSAAFSLPVGQISQPIEMPYGWHVLTVVERTEASTRPFDEVRDLIRQRIMTERYNAEFQAFIEKARDEAEWCVKPKYRSRLAVPSPECSAL